MNTQFHTVADVAVILDSTADQVVALIHAGYLPALNIAANPGRPRWRISQEQLDTFIASRSAKPTQAQTRRRKTKQPEVIQFFS